MRTAVILSIGALVLSGCNDSKKANDDNFRKAIDTGLAARPMCVDVPMESLKPAGDDGKATFPIYVEMPKASAPQDLFRTRTRELDALVSAGLLAAKIGTIEVATLWAGSNSALPVKIYDLTDKGRQALDKPGDRPRDFLASSRDRFCYGTPQVVGITQFTEPADAMGMKASRASYTWRLKDQAEWSKLPAMIEAFPALKTATDGPAEASTDLVLTNNGWVDARAMRR